MEKTDEYAMKIISAIQELFNPESDNYIDPEELTEGQNGTHFAHALGNIAPAMIYNKLTSEDKTALEFNHLANVLCFQYGKKA